MSRSNRIGSMMLSLLAAVAFSVAGCGKDDTKVAGATNKGLQTEKAAPATTAKGHDHTEWWCEEHGIPEHLCKMCKEELRTKSKEDATCEHDLVKSQCFRCNPKQREYYARMYQEKYGKAPPPAKEQGDLTKDDKEPK